MTDNINTHEVVGIKKEPYEREIIERDGSDEMNVYIIIIEEISIYHLSTSKKYGGIIDPAS